MKWYFWILFLGLFLVRFLISTVSYNPDMNNHFKWISSIRESGFYGFYERDYYPFAQANYPPLINESFYSSDILAQKLGVDDLKIKASLYKLPAVFSETLAIVLLGSLFGPFLLVILLVNPGIFYNTLLWGQTEGLVASLIVFCLYFTFKKRLYLSWLMLILSILIKQSALVFLPIVFLVNFKQFGYKKNLLPTLLAVIIFLLFFIPYYGCEFITRSILFLLRESQGQAHQAQGSVNALNFWYLVGKNQVSDSLKVLGLSYRNIGILLTLVSYIYLLIIAYKAKLDLKKSLILAGLANFEVCLFMTRIHERHLLPTLILIAPMAFSSVLNFSIYSVISLIGFYNLYLIWNERFRSAEFNELALLSFVLIACYLVIVYLFTKSFLRTKN